MAELIGQKRGKTAQMQYSDGMIIYRTSLIYIVYDSSGTQSEASIVQESFLPKIAEPFDLPDVPYKVACRNKRGDQWPLNKKYWTITCECDNETKTPSQLESDGNDPTQWVSKVNLDYETDEEPIVTDLHGQPVVNRLYRRYDTQPVRKRLIPVVKFYQYEPSQLRLVEILSRSESVNQSPWLGGAKGTWLLTVADCDLYNINGFQCWKVYYEARYRYRKMTDGLLIYLDPNTGSWTLATDGLYHWQPTVLQADYIDINNDPCVDDKGNNIRGTLDANGLQVTSSAMPAFARHDIYPEIDFSFLRVNQDQ